MNWGYLVQFLHFDHRFFYDMEIEIKTEDTTIKVDLCKYEFCNHIDIFATISTNSKNLIDEKDVPNAINKAIFQLYKHKLDKFQKIKKRKNWERQKIEKMKNWKKEVFQKGVFCSNCGEKTS